MKLIAGIDSHYTSIALSLMSLESVGGWSEGDWVRRHMRTDFFKMPDLTKRKGNFKAIAIKNIRISELFTTTYRWLNEHRPDVVGIEAYSTFKGMSGSADKMIMAVTAVKCAILAYGKMPMEYMASETRRIILGKQSGTKEEVWAATERLYPELNYQKVAEGNKEHLRDSLAVAENAVRELIENQGMAGISI
jgi:Holliday junction resolvasome RuvABC endonuclease subunit